MVGSNRSPALFGTKRSGRGDVTAWEWRQERIGGVGDKEGLASLGDTMEAVSPGY